MHTSEAPPAVDSPAANAAFPAVGLQEAQARPVETRRCQTTPPDERPEPVMQKKTCSCPCRRSNKPHRSANCNSGSAVFFTSCQALLFRRKSMDMRSFWLTSALILRTMESHIPSLPSFSRSANESHTTRGRNGLFRHPPFHFLAFPTFDTCLPYHAFP